MLIFAEPDFLDITKNTASCFHERVVYTHYSITEEYIFKFCFCFFIEKSTKTKQKVLRNNVLVVVVVVGDRGWERGDKKKYGCYGFTVVAAVLSKVYSFAVAPYSRHHHWING